MLIRNGSSGKLGDVKAQGRAVRWWWSWRLLRIVLLSNRCSHCKERFVQDMMGFVSEYPLGSACKQPAGGILLWHML